MSELPPPGLARRLAAVLYDGLLLAPVLMIAEIPVTALFEDVSHGPAAHANFLYLLALAFGFYAYQWRRGGQTLGLKAWRCRVERLDGSPLGWREAALRYLAALLSWALLGAGFLWIAFDPDRRALHDILSRTRVRRLP